jgi:hypothetical protein
MKASQLSEISRETGGPGRIRSESLKLREMDIEARPNRKWIRSISVLILISCLFLTGCETIDWVQVNPPTGKHSMPRAATAEIISIMDKVASQFGMRRGQCSTVAPSDAFQTLTRYLQHLWTETVPEPIPEALRRNTACSPRSLSS